MGARVSPGRCEAADGPVVDGARGEISHDGFPMR
jgi:hypothetical protein